MKPSLTRRSFVGAASAGLAGAGFLAAGARSLYAAVAGKTNTLALHGGTPVRAKPFSTTWPILDEREEKALIKALRSRNWCCLRGSAVYDFEKVFAEAMGVPRCVLTNGGTTALSASLHVIGVGPGDEVITSPHTFIATINTITNLHALPIYVDVDPDTGSIDADRIEAAITEHTRAILPVHLAGWPVDIEKIMAISSRHNIPVVEDACQSAFAAVNGRKVGTFGLSGCISFQEWKSLVCGEGGAILGRDDEFMRRCAAFINNGRDPKRLERGYPFPGSNHRMTEFQAAVLAEQFKRFEKDAPRRHENGRYVEEALAKVPGLALRKRYSDNTWVTYVQFEMGYDRAQLKNVPAARFAEALRAENIPMHGGPRRYTGGCHKEKMLEEHLSSRAFQAAFPKARLDKYRQSLRLPVMDGQAAAGKERLTMDSKIPFLGSRDEMDQIIEAVHKVARNLDKLA
ncbi:MAG TPA: DegT/DnrJ/EryC1/StrS family aminotransferase [Phycisphaerae bacterium]|nr:DegT/DnrJ/EryC1/StrS family aminotransferase [Phycisphaerae bacterium]